MPSSENDWTLPNSDYQKQMQKAYIQFIADTDKARLIAVSILLERRDKK